MILRSSCAEIKVAEEELAGVQSEIANLQVCAM
jgi:hypothetical protein